MKTVNGTEYEAVHTQALQAGDDAAQGVPNDLPCGFAHIVIDAEESFGRWLSARPSERTFDPGSGDTQFIARTDGDGLVKNRAWADAYTFVLRTHGIGCGVYTRFD